MPAAAWFDRRAAGSRMRHVAYRSLAALSFVLGVVATILVVSRLTYAELAEQGTLRRVDFLIPVLAVSFEGFVEIAKSVVNALERAVGAGVGWVLALVGSGRRDE